MRLQTSSGRINSGVPELMGLAGQRFEEFADLWEEGDE
jgi:hypothetical protein